jgi:hypothetical protein
MTISPSILSKYKKFADVFIETGTYLGHTSKAAAQIGFKKIYTIEIAHNYYDLAKTNLLQFTQVECIFGDSQIELVKILDSLNETAVFWLDGHFSGGDTGSCIDAVPLYKELELIKTHHIKNHILLIDDIRLLGNEWETLSLNGIKDRCLNINKNYKFSFENGYVPNDILVVCL